MSGSSQTALLTVTRTHSVSAVLAGAAGLGSLDVGQTIGYDPTGTTGRHGTHHRIIDIDGRPRPGLALTRADDPLVQPCLSTLGLFHQACDQASARLDPNRFPLAGAPAWHGLVRDAGGQSFALLIGEDPAANGLVPLRTVLGDDPAGHLARPLIDRLGLAGAVAACGVALADLPLTHGSINASTILVSPTGPRIAALAGAHLGAVGRPGQWVPARVGEADGYLAPETQDTWGVMPEAVTERSDRWALAVAMHHIVFGTHPYVCLPSLAPDAVRTALHDHGWPYLSADLPVEYADWYRRELAALPQALLDLYQEAYAEGWDDPARRPSARRWRDEIDRWSAPPRFDRLDVDRTWVPLGDRLTVSWRTSHASRVELVGWGPTGSLAVPVSGSVELLLDTTGPVHLRATGPLGTVEAATQTVLVTNLPRFAGQAPTAPTVEVPRPVAVTEEDRVPRPTVRISRPGLTPARPTRLPARFPRLVARPRRAAPRFPVDAPAPRPSRLIHPLPEEDNP